MKWFFFSLGFLPAVIIVMALTLLASESRIVPPPKSRLALKDSMILMIPAGTGTAAGAGPGAGIASQNAHLWILSKRTPSETDRRILGESFEGPRFNLAAYRVEPWGGWSKQGQVTFLAARDISYDTKLISLDSKGLQEYIQMRKAWEDAIEKIKE